MPAARLVLKRVLEANTLSPQHSPSCPLAVLLHKLWRDNWSLWTRRRCRRLTASNLTCHGERSPGAAGHLDSHADAGTWCYSPNKGSSAGTHTLEGPVAWVRLSGTKCTAPVHLRSLLAHLPPCERHPQYLAMPLMAFLLGLALGVSDVVVRVRFVQA